MSKKSTTADSIEPVNPYFAGGSRSAADLARAIPAVRPVRPTTSRSRIAAAKFKVKRVRAMPMGPTPERLAKGDIGAIGGVHRSIPTVERLRDQGKLDHDARINQALFEAAQKLQRHFASSLIGVRAQDLDRIVTAGASDDLTQEESWVYSFDQFRMACKLMGWFEANPHRGAGRLVVAIACGGQTVTDAAKAYLPPARKEVMIATAMDRLREGLFCLAVHWRMI